MPKSRKHFLTAAGIVTAGLVAKADAKTLASPTAAREVALSMRRFDPALTHAELGTLEKGVRDIWKLGDSLHKGLDNSDAPSPSFRTGE